jgi:hypothetical protein
MRPGVNDPDFPDLPPAGWSGTITTIVEYKGQINGVFKRDGSWQASTRS